MLDEPAIHLHVDAQKEVLELFENIAQNNIQIVYTTHSPALLNINSWESIRLVEKDDDISKVFTTTTPRSGEKHLETLSPIQKAMGCSLNNTIAPSREKLNLVVEGITDYYYLKAMLGNFGILGTPDEPYLIPACSADNIPNIVSIFIGWGYNYKVLLDNDRQGQNVAKKLKELDIPNDKILFVGESSDDFTIENLLSTPNKDAITICKKNDVFDKSASAFNFLSSVENKQLTPDNITKNNFQELFQRLGILKRCMENYK